MIVRPAAPSDASAIRAVNESAFGRPLEAGIVEELTGRIEPCISLVADRKGDVVGHIFFTRVHLHPDDAAAAPLPAMGLGPMAVLPELQKRGIGSRLVEAGFDVCRKIGENVVFVLGHPAYYPRFGFVPAKGRGIRFQVPVPDGVFLVRELEPDALSRHTGEVRYHPCFSEA